MWTHAKENVLKKCMWHNIMLYILKSRNKSVYEMCHNVKLHRFINEQNIGAENKETYLVNLLPESGISKQLRKDEFLINNIKTCS